MPSARAATVASIVALMVSGSAPAGEAVTQRREAPFVVGEVFPDIALPSLEHGAPTRLSDFRGRKVMLHVFASW